MILVLMGAARAAEPTAAQLWADLCAPTIEKMKALPCAGPPPARDQCAVPPEVRMAEPASVRAMFACIERKMGCTADGKMLPVTDCQREIAQKPAPPAPPAPPPAPRPAGETNQKSCIAFVGAFNAAPCMTIEMDASAMCPASLDLSPCDMRPYYACMAAAVRCSGDFVDVSRQANCRMTCN